MSGNANNAPMLKTTPLWAKTSAKGSQYFTGRLSGVKVLVLENRDQQRDDDTSHHLFFAEAQPRQGAQEPGDGPRAPRHSPGAPETIPASLQRLPAACRRQSR